MVYHDTNYSKIWLSGYYNRIEFEVGEVSYDKLVEINCCDNGTKETKIKKLFVNVMSESIFYITTDDKVYGIGNNNEGQLGIGSNKKTRGPQLISSLSNVADIQSSEYCSIALCKSDVETTKIIISYWVRLYNLPNDIGSLIMIFSQITTCYSTDFSGNGENGQGYVGGSESEYKWKEIAALKNVEIVEISAGDGHTLFLDVTGNVWSCGKNYSSQLGLGDNGSDPKSVPTLIEYFKNNSIRIQKIDSGINHNLALDYDGNVYSWGENGEHQCGFENNEEISTPKRLAFEEIMEDIQCGANHSYCKSVDGKHYLFGRNRRNECLIGMNDDDDDDGSSGNNCIQTPTCINDIIEK